jgi:hypothetical protein
MSTLKGFVAFGNVLTFFFHSFPYFKNIGNGLLKAKLSEYSGIYLTHTLFILA